MKTVTRLTEVCIGSVVSAIEAAKGGASRVELCDNLPEGGTTPSAGSIEACLNITQLKTMVMIRPRGGDFLYNETEFDIMKRDIKVARQLGAHGVVFGILKPDGTLDRERMLQLIELSGDMDITCHRAFDMTRDPFEAMESLIGMGIRRILTSGQQPKAPLGTKLIAKLVEKAANRIIIMPGAGVNENTIGLMVTTGATEFHIAPTRQVESAMDFRNPAVNMGASGQDEYKTLIIDYERVKRVTDYLNQL